MKSWILRLLSVISVYCFYPGSVCCNLVVCHVSLEESLIVTCNKLKVKQDICHSLSIVFWQSFLQGSDATHFRCGGIFNDYGSSLLVSCRVRWWKNLENLSAYAEVMDTSTVYLFLLKKKKNLFFAQKPNIKINKHVNKVRKATGRAEDITAGRQQNKQQYLIIQLMKKKESITTGQERQQLTHNAWKLVQVKIIFLTVNFPKLLIHVFQPSKSINWLKPNCLVLVMNTFIHHLSSGSQANKHADKRAAFLYMM